jgi:hypothetical protein
LPANSTPSIGMSQKDKNYVSSAIRENLVRQVSHYMLAYDSDLPFLSSRDRLIGALLMAKHVGGMCGIPTKPLYEEASLVAKKKRARDYREGFQDLNGNSVYPGTPCPPVPTLPEYPG